MHPDYTIGGFKWGHNTCGCGHGAHCHLSYRDGLCMYSLLEESDNSLRRSCKCDGYMPQAFWIQTLWEEFE